MWHLRWLVRTRADISLRPTGLVRPEFDIKLWPSVLARTGTDIKLQEIGMIRLYVQGLIQEQKSFLIVIRPLFRVSRGHTKSGPITMLVKPKVFISKLKDAD